MISKVTEGPSMHSPHRSRALACHSTQTAAATCLKAIQDQAATALCCRQIRRHHDSAHASCRIQAATALQRGGCTETRRQGRNHHTSQAHTTDAATCRPQHCRAETPAQAANRGDPVTAVRKHRVDRNKAHRNKAHSRGTHHGSGMVLATLFTRHVA
jgi:hypothetical protein